jgi:hypothetical protein
MATSRKDIGPDGHSSRKDIDPDGHIKQNVVEESDVEGHSMFINPTVGRDLSRARDAEVDRGMRQRQQAAEAKRVFKKP